MKYDCPPANKFGADPPLWRTALENFVHVLELAVSTMDRIYMDLERSGAIWALIVDVFAGVLLADSSAESAEDDEAFVLPLLNRFHAAISPRLSTIPNVLVPTYTETLRKASVLYRYDVSYAGGTTAPAIPERSEGMKYWAFDALIMEVSGDRAAGSEANGMPVHVAKRAVESLVKRIEGSLRGYVDDARLRGQMPLGR
jgi:hypothetical protein